MRKVMLSWGAQYYFNSLNKITSPLIRYFSSTNSSTSEPSPSLFTSPEPHPIQPLLAFDPSYQFNFHLSHRSHETTSIHSFSRNPRHYHLMRKVEHRRTRLPPKCSPTLRRAKRVKELRPGYFLVPSSSSGTTSSFSWICSTFSKHIYSPMLHYGHLVFDIMQLCFHALVNFGPVLCFLSTMGSSTTSTVLSSVWVDNAPSFHFWNDILAPDDFAQSPASLPAFELHPDMDIITLHRLSTMMLPIDSSPTHWVSVAKQECHRFKHLIYNYSCTDHVLPGSYLSPSSIFLSQHDERQVPIVIDTGASTGLSPFRQDFITYTKQKSTVSGIAHESEVLGFGTVRWEIIDEKGTKQFVETEAYHVPSATIRLYSPQAHFRKERSGSLYLDHLGCSLTLPSKSKGTKPLSFPYNHFNGLPLMLRAPSDPTHSTALLMEEDLTYATSVLQNGSSSSTLPFSTEMYPSVPRSDILAALEQQYGCNANVADESNKNLRSAQVELLKWHFRLGHVNMDSIQRLMCHSKSFDNHNTSDNLQHPRIIPTKYKSTATCDVPKCAACILGKMERIPKSTTCTRDSTNGRLFDGNLEPGDCISMDQYVVSQKGRTLSNSSRNHLKYNGGTLFIDHASGRVFNHLQISLRSAETLLGKRLLEHEAADLGISVKGFRSDNGIFVSDAFQSDCRLKQQRLKRCGVGAHHQNGVAERFIKTICYLTRAQMIHAAICWPKRADLELWPFAFDHSVYLYNNLPSRDGLTPEEKWSGSKHRSFSHIRRLHPWGCPAYVLDPKLQDGQKLPKWNPRSRQGQFLGYSKDHATNVGLILNPRTKRISPQFHVLYDDFFTTVRSADDVCEPSFTEGDWTSLIRRNGGTENVFEHDSGVAPPPLDAEWQDTPNPAPAPTPPVPPTAVPRPQRENPNEIDDVAQHREREQSGPLQREHQHRPPASPPVLQREDDFDPHNDEDSSTSPELQRENPEQSPIQREMEPSSTTIPTANDPPLRRSGRIRQQNKRYFNDDFANTAASSLPSFHTMSRAMKELKRKTTKFDAHMDYLKRLDWDQSMAALADSSSSFQSQQFFANMSKYEDPITHCLDESHPLALAAKANDADNPRWHEATSGENSEGFWDAMWKEIKTLEEKNVWEQVPRDKDMRVVPVTWAFKIKRFPSGLVRKLKARLCARGDMQKQGIDYFESFAPVVSWTTVRTLLILSVMLGLKSSQVDYVAAFCQAPMNKDTYIHLPQGWEILNRMGGFKEPFKSGHVLKLNRSIYGLCESPSNFFKYLKGNLEKCGFKQSPNDPCLFISPTVICLVYVDDCLFFSRSQKDIDKSIEAIRACGMELNKEDDAAGFLGVQIEKRPDGNIALTQKGLTDRIVEGLGLTDSNPKATAAPQTALGRDVDGEPFSQEFNYASIVGMMLYLCNNSRPDISFAVSQCARYTHRPTAMHAQYLKHIGRYLKGTREQGLILNPTGNPLNIECYVDADFAGLWDPAEEADPHCVRSRSGWVILIGGCPVIWKSKLISEICLSTMESEYISLSKSCRDLLPLRRLVAELGDALDLEHPGTTTIKCTIWEDNQAALKLATLELPYMTNRSKHIAIKYHWFRSHVGKEWEVRPIDTKDQLADMFTKGLPRDTFERLRFKLMGW